MPNSEKHTRLADEAATLEFGRQLAERTVPGSVIYLRGELGAGKTTLVRGFLRALGYSGPVKSPTYTLLESYELDALHVLHMDLYRLNDPEEWSFLGVDAYFADPKLVALIEWPEQAEALLPAPTVDITLRHCAEGRDVVLSFP